MYFVFRENSNLYIILRESSILEGINMNVRDNVFKLWHQQRKDIKSVAELERKIGLSNGIIQQWKDNNPSIKNAQKVADFFHVPLEKILSKVKHVYTASDDITAQDQEMLSMFRKHTKGMSKSEKEEFQASLELLMDTAKTIIDNKNNEGKKSNE